MGASGQIVVNIDTQYLQVTRQNPLPVKTYHFKNATSNFNEFSIQYVCIHIPPTMSLKYADFITSATKSPQQNFEVCTICCMFWSGAVHRRYFLCMYSRSSRIRKFNLWIYSAEVVFGGRWGGFLSQLEAEFLDETQTKVLRVFLLAIQRHLYSFALRLIFL